jgi:DNA sulfur modification protein DndD
MKIDSITLTNFRQYYGDNTIELSPTPTKNIIIVGGKNGYGKTNFLISLVWCLYGEDIAKIDESFKREIQKAGNYNKFLKDSLNWDAQKEGIDTFSIEMAVYDIELPETKETKPGANYKCKLKRTYDTKSAKEDFSIIIDGMAVMPFTDNDEKRLFINDFMVPVEAAKFVFFDAEKIASWAELSTKEEGSVLNDALGKILGLDVYESLIEDLDRYTDSLRKESATAQVKQQITTTEKGIELNVEKIAEFEGEILKKEATISTYRVKILEYETFITRHGSKIVDATSLEEFYKQKKELENKRLELENRFNELCEIFPFAIAAGTLEEVIDHLSKQEEDESLKEQQTILMEKNGEMVEKLFNNPPFPLDGDISFAKKIFYSEKAKRVIEEVFGNADSRKELEFTHDLNKSEKELISETYRHLQKQSKELFEQTIDSFNRIKNDITETDRIIRKIESDQQDEEILRYTNNKNDAQRKIEKLIEEKGSLQKDKDILRRENEKQSQMLQILVKKIDVTMQKKKKLEKANNYIKVIETFVINQKKSKCSILEGLIFSEMQKLMHKLQDSKSNEFVAAVKAELLPDNDGLKILLLDKNGEIRHKETLSQGEKQIYISSLIKAILSLSVQEYPIFIDTPLGRLDDEHIKNVLLNYYPDLASQVVLMATNNELPPSRYRLIEDVVAKTYLLDSKNNRTKFKKGYFQSYEN